MKTFRTRPTDVRRTWHVLDATGQPLGRLATQAATYLRGKHKPIYSPHMDVGDFVVVVNAAKVRLTGRKMEQKRYYHHSGYPGGMKVREVKHELDRLPERVIERAVHGMLPKGPLGLHLFRHLKVYRGPDHPHAAQINGSPPPPFVAGLPGSDTPNAPLHAPAGNVTAMDEQDMQPASAAQTPDAPQASDAPSSPADQRGEE
jgi:large subunit ribosomal protein L13